MENSTFKINRQLHELLGARVGTLVDKKQLQYGDSFGRAGGVLRILYPDGIPPEALEDLLVVVRIVDKLFRIATAKGGKDSAGESPWQDIVGYGLLALRRAEGAEANRDRPVSGEESISISTVKKSTEQE